ncbi:MAG: hypothetical protein ACTSVA_09445 [Candidatus Njordarchaeales archaeon]|mgnify:CR=1 FL=1
MAEDDFSLDIELMTDTLSRILHEIINEAEKSFAAGSPYYILPKRWLQKKLRGARGLQYIIKQLKRKYKVVEDGSWYILTNSKNRSPK